MSDEQEIWNAVTSIFESFAARNEAGIENRLAEDCTVWDVFEPELIRGRAERDAFHARDRAQSEARGAFTWNLVPVEATLFGDVAIARYYLDFEYQPPGAARGRVRITDVLRRGEHGWQIIHHHEGLSPQGAPPLD
jgi:ketosteroid isomerase-like protein